MNPILTVLNAPAAAHTAKQVEITLDGKRWLVLTPTHDGYAEGAYKLNANGMTFGPAISAYDEHAVPAILALASLRDTSRPRKGLINEIAETIISRCAVKIVQAAAE